MSERKEFKAESRRLLDLMINSIYTHKEIFLRELISNASDALDKYYLDSLKNHKIPEKLAIRIDFDENARMLTISDNGIGMTKEELEDNLGTIAKSGSLAFKEELKKEKEAGENPEASSDSEAAANSDVDIIGQFGVGFYSAFMVASKVTVVSKALGSDQAWKWESDGTDGYTIEEAERDDHGTTITLLLKEDDENEKYSEYLNSWKLEMLVKKYSDYIRYPIEMDITTQKPVKPDEEAKEAEELAEPKFETVTETRTLNSMIPLWKKQKSEITQEEFDQFYQDHFNNYTKPLDTIFFNIDGSISFTALLYVPSKRPENFYSSTFKPGLELYSRGVLIESHSESLLPDYLRFMQGLVDSQDLSLNISREMLQHDHQLRFIRKQTERKVLSALVSMQEKKPEDYLSFWKNFGISLKIGIYNSQGADTSKLENLLMYPTSDDGKYKSLKEFVASMPEEDKDIYYLSGTNIDTLNKLPAAAKLKAKGYPVLYLTDEVDEFIIQMISQYDGHSFKNAAQGDLDLDTEEEKEALKTQNEENKDLLTYMKDVLPEVSEVRLSNRLVDDPVMLVAGDGLSFEMEHIFDVFAKQAGEDTNPGLQASRILEINPNNPIWNVLRTEYVTDKDKVKEIAQILYDQACLIQGFAIKDPVEYSRKVASLLSTMATADAKKD